MILAVMILATSIEVVKSRQVLCSDQTIERAPVLQH